MRVLLRVPATPRDSAARGKAVIEQIRIRSEIPGASRCSTARVASGVTSRGPSPVPPVVRIRSAASASHQPVSAETICVVSSGTSIRPASAHPFPATHCAAMSPDVSARSPRAPASEIVRIATRTLRPSARGREAANCCHGVKICRLGRMAWKGDHTWDMNTRDLTAVLPALLAELVHGSTDPSANTSMLNRGDQGLLASLDKISASAASTARAGGATIAAHVDHLRYGLSLLNRWASGEEAPWINSDWTASWQKSQVTSGEWQELRHELRREADRWLNALREPRELGDRQITWTIGSVAHLAYHMGAIRQIDRATRGPTAEDEARLGG